MQDVKTAAEDAQRAYELRSSRKGKAQRYLSAFSSRIMYYGVIMDTLSQHHPEYVSLAWGAIKFLFIVGKISFYYHLVRFSQLAVTIESEAYGCMPRA